MARLRCVVNHTAAPKPGVSPIRTGSVSSNPTSNRPPPSSKPPARSPEESEARLAQLKTGAAKEFRRQKRAEERNVTSGSPARSRRHRWWIWPVGFVVLVLLPFGVLVRTSVWLYSRMGVPTWGALAAGMALTVFLLGLYGAGISKSLTGRARFRATLKWVALPVLIAYAGYTLVYLSGNNAKTEAVRTTYTSLHPLFRLALSTAIVFDRGLLVTDVQRVPADYVAMGLPVYEASLHFRQSDGYVHAVDLRTMGRPAWRNRMTALYFRLMGFRTLRHVGTADHLHVSLPMRE
jgi:hypothetical protein